MAAFFPLCLIMWCLAYTRCESCVTESKFAELIEEMRALKEKVLTLEKKLDANAKQEKTETEFTIVDKNQENETEIHKTGVSKVGGIRNRTMRNFESKSINGQEVTNVAFYAYLGGKRCYAMHKVFIFDTVETNVGNGYNSHDGIFDAPITGVYVFTYTVTPDFHNFIYAELIVDGVIRDVIIADSQEIHDIHPATATAVVHVTAGQHVCVRKGTNSKCNILSNNISKTTFAGWLLF
ncbi:complement C1q-like protein 4 isoform X2 [Ruditapes philippinarum]|uniref:complement C1q-like protein 4 isoform X2 n=1 Tax=Ruditapes philippinarum TaxID=129788 RepID=UPI00295C3163|nr:complement C1q-like protein 4 isoform X2 [Ruditapes philippinarum]